MSKLVPIGAFVLVVTVTDSERAHRDDRASPRKPNVWTVVKSEKEDSFEVQCFNASSRVNDYIPPGLMFGSPILSWSSSLIPHPLSTTSIALSP